MRFIHYFIPVLVLFVLSSCGKEDTQPVGNGIEGEWQLTAIEYKETETSQSDGQNIVSENHGTGTDMDLHLSILEDPDVLSTEGEYWIDLTTSFFGQPVVSRVPDNGFFPSSGSWQFTDGTLTVVPEAGSTKVLEVQEVNTKRLILTLEESFAFNGTEGTFLKTRTGTYTFERR
jgi:hypothetical protein